MTTNGKSQEKPIAAQERTPLEEFVNGFPMKLAEQTRKANLAQLFIGEDVSAYFNSRAAEFLPTAVLPARQPMMQFGNRPMPEVGKVKAETEHHCQ